MQLELPLEDHAITSKDQILQAKLIVLRAAVRLEALGMTKRGKSATRAARELLGYPPNTHREELINALTALIDSYYTN